MVLICFPLRSIQTNCQVAGGAAAENQQAIVGG